MATVVSAAQMVESTMTTVLVAPTERPPISQLGMSSSYPESIGADIAFNCKHGLVGIQRKEISDLINSVRDGRLGKEFEQLQVCHLRFLIVEGQPAWDREGNLVSQHTRWSLKQQDGVLLSAQTKGVFVLTSRNPLETCAKVEYLIQWSDKDEHVSSLLARPSPSKNGWGRLDDRSTAIHVLSGFEGISTELASRIFDAFGRVPLSWDVSEEDLRGVPGIGPKRATRLMEAMGSRETGILNRTTKP